MRIFEHPNYTKGQSCPICGLATDSPVVLIPIYGTNTDSNMTYEARVIHVDCLDGLMIYPLSSGFSRIEMIYHELPTFPGQWSKNV